MATDEPLEQIEDFGDTDLQAFADQVATTVDWQDEADGYQEQGAKALVSKIRELEESLASEENKYQRLLADFQNLRNRTARDIKSGAEQAERQILLDVLPLLDSFNRCLSSAYSGVDDFRTGVELIQRQFYDMLRRLKVTEIEIKVGDIFDAHVSEALATSDSSGMPEGSVVDIYEKGYRVGSQLLRPARVVVASGGASS